jgi:hypothetical protein
VKYFDRVVPIVTVVISLFDLPEYWLEVAIGCSVCAPPYGECEPPLEAIPPLIVVPVPFRLLYHRDDVGVVSPRQTPHPRTVMARFEDFPEGSAKRVSIVPKDQSSTIVKDG